MLFFCYAVGASALSFPNIVANVHDLAPLHAGKLVALTMTAGGLAQIGGPLVVGKVTKQQSTYDEWRIVFFLSAALYVVGAAAFVTFGSVEHESWAEPQKQPATPKK